MAASSQTSYKEILDVLEALPMIIREARRRKGISLRQAAIEAGVAPSTMMRAEAGMFDLRLEVVKALLRWVENG